MRKDQTLTGVLLADHATGSEDIVPPVGLSIGSQASNTPAPMPRQQSAQTTFVGTGTAVTTTLAR